MEQGDFLKKVKGHKCYIKIISFFSYLYLANIFTEPAEPILSLWDM